MTYEQWQKVREECHNAKKVSFAGLSKEAQDAMREACKSMGAPVDWVGCDGSWEPIHLSFFYQCNTYRINPSWPGPSKPEPVVEYEDVLVECPGTMFGYEGRYLSAAGSDIRFAGYVMPDGLLAPCLIFDEQKDGTYRLRVPKAVRLIKEVAK